jgi:hypothetical protein
MVLRSTFGSTREYISCTLAEYYMDNQINKGVVSGACRTRRRKRYLYRVEVRKLKEKKILEDRAEVGRIILK